MCGPTPNLDHAVENLVDGAFFNSGQCCCGIERIYVHETPSTTASSKGAVDLVNDYVLGNPLDEATTLGPMAHKRFADLVRQQTREAVAKGAKAHIDAKRFAADTGDTAYLAPQVLTGVDHSMSVMREESFGPVVGIMKVQRRRGGDPPDERFALRPHRRDLDAGCRCGRSASAARSRPARSS